MHLSSTLTKIGFMVAILAIDPSWSGSGMPMASAYSINRPRATTLTRYNTPATNTALTANKPKRRKRKDSSNENDDSLPDFDIADPLSSEGSLTSEKETLPTGKSKAKKTGSLDEITPAMMGTSLLKETSVNDLIRDRSLESKFAFDEASEDTSLPDLAVLPGSGSSSPGKKKARQAARIAAAQQKQEDEEGSLLSKVPFILDEKGEVSAIKILENGTWLGIGILVGWELYINSPFFDRAQPMIPVVYDLFV